MKNTRFQILVVIVVLPLCCCKPQIDVVASGTYRAVVDKVVPGQSEIHVKTLGDDRLHLHFNGSTELTQGGQVVPFEALKKGQQVDVTVDNVGEELRLIAVAIAE